MGNPISQQQLDLNRSLHESDPAFGNRDAAAGVAARLPLALRRMHEINACSSSLITELAKDFLSIVYAASSPTPSVQTRPERYRQDLKVHDIVTCLDWNILESDPSTQC